MAEIKDTWLHTGSDPRQIKKQLSLIAASILLACGMSGAIAADGKAAPNKGADLTASQNLAEEAVDAHGKTLASAEDDFNRAKFFFKSEKYKEAYPYVRNAAENGLIEAQTALGRMYENGLGVKKDEQEAVVWYKKAAEKGNADAQFSLAWMYQHGHGVTKDEAEAEYWYRKATNQKADPESQSTRVLNKLQSKR